MRKQRKGFRDFLVPARILTVNFGMRMFIASLFFVLIAFGQDVAATSVAMANTAVVFTEEQTKAIEKLLEGVAVKHTEAVKALIVEATKGYLTMDQLNTHLKSSGADKEATEKLVKALQEQGEALKKLTAGEGKPNAVKSIEEVVMEKKEAIQKLASGSKEIVTLTFSRAAIKTLVQRSAVDSGTIALRLADVAELPYLQSVISSLFRHQPVGPNSGGVIRYIDQKTVTRNADAKAEAAQKPESAIEWIERTLSIRKIADSIPVTKEAFNDVTFIRGEIERLLLINIQLKEDDQLWDGDGNDPNIKGVYTSAAAFNGAIAPYAGTVTDANVYDLIATVRVAIMSGKQSKYNPNTIVMNPVDTLGMKLSKAVDGHYILPPFIAANGQSVDGMRVVESSQVTANTLLVGDFRYGTIYDLEDVTVEIGHVNDQFIKNTMTILAEKREALLIRTVDADAFMKVTDIAESVNDITKIG